MVFLAVCAAVAHDVQTLQINVTWMPFIPSGLCRQVMCETQMLYSALLSLFDEIAPLWCLNTAQDRSQRNPSDASPQRSSYTPQTSYPPHTRNQNSPAHSSAFPAPLPSVPASSPAPGMFTRGCTGGSNDAYGERTSSNGSSDRGRDEWPEQCQLNPHLQEPRSDSLCSMMGCDGCVARDMPARMSRRSAGPSSGSSLTGAFVADAVDLDCSLSLVI
jgi:hypothetical protein